MKNEYSHYLREANNQGWLLLQSIIITKTTIQKQKVMYSLNISREIILWIYGFEQFCVKYFLDCKTIVYNCNGRQGKIFEVIKKSSKFVKCFSLNILGYTLASWLLWWSVAQCLPSTCWDTFICCIVILMATWPNFLY